jgi:hypothetical protein
MLPRAPDCKPKLHRSGGTGRGGDERQHNYADVFPVQNDSKVISHQRYNHHPGFQSDPAFNERLLPFPSISED